MGKGEHRTTLTGRQRISREIPASRAAGLTLARHKELDLELIYETPEILDTFGALEVMGAAEGSTCGNGSLTYVLCPVS